MWSRLRERVFNAIGVVVLIAWFLASTAIATGPLGLKAERSNLGIVMLIFLAPAAAVVVIQELVHRIRFGPTKPGRHARKSLEPDFLAELDRGLKRDGDGAAD